MSRLGVIAENESDVDAFKVLVGRIVPKLGVKRRSANGCGKLVKKAPTWMQELADSRCSGVVLLHDLDKNHEPTLLATLNAIPVPKGIQRFICIPAEELEAWFWADTKVLSAIGRKTVQAHPSPHLVRSPKEALQKLSADAGGRPRYSENDNAKYAAQLDLDMCAQRCRSFADLRQFLVTFASAT